MRGKASSPRWSGSSFFGVQAEVGFELEIVDIGGDPDLEARYRESIPVVEIDCVQTFTYFVDADALRSRLADRG